MKMTTIVARRLNLAGLRGSARGILSSAVLAAMAVSAPIAGWSQDVQRGGEVVQAEWIAVPSLDPHLSSAVNSYVWPNLFDGLFTYTPPQEEGGTYTTGPGLAASIEREGDGVIVVQLREGVSFHDGTPVNAEAIKWNLERARDHELSTRKDAVANLESVEVVDDLTVKLTFTEEQPLFEVLFSSANPANIYFVSPTAAEQVGDEAFGRAPVGSGPFKLVEFRADDRMEMVANEAYWAEGLDGEPLPYVDALTIRFVPNQSVGAVELRAGSIHVAELLETDVLTLKDDPNVKLYEVPLTDKGYPSFYMASNPDLDTPFAQDVRLRRAVQHAINREAMAKVVGLGAAVAEYHWGWYPGVPGYDESLPRYEYDPDKARELLAEAGYPDGISLEVKVINRPRDVKPLEIMQAMLAEVGIDLSINLMDRTPWIDAGRAGNFEALSHGNTADVEPLMRQTTKTGSSSNWANFSSAEIDKLWEDAAQATSMDERAEIYREMQRIMHEEAVHLVAYRIPTVLGYAANLHGLDQTAGLGMHHVWLEQ
ncbi:ABC transporter substrate-binding protein [Silicimonas algicola]|uniref:Peptide/nickel transport system substrate-binding protein n=1 Tax=Silicimonas algicola TaxID=1826607 RepID=A0A316GRG5_9RHOB|nr:ABC transporter substrate-binding protein [Silicimonas algicola]AZQ67962.1 ABC transporter substrate-binding protein [Silicimonas algicola]PWK57597.1 peptide/nickel transport system substrate-binding protein [Silicimonas algicola]